MGGIGSVLLHKQFKFGGMRSGASMMIYNELHLVSIACDDRVCRGLDWTDALFGDQDCGQLLGMVNELQLTDSGGYEVMVVWDHGHEDNYRFGLSSCFDIDIVQRARAQSKY